MQKINYEMAESFNIGVDYWFVFVGSKKTFYDFKKFCLKQNFIVPQVEWRGKYMLFKIPVDKNNKKIVMTSGGITVWGALYRQIGLIYDPYKFKEDYLAK